MSASMHRYTCHALGVCQDRQPPCNRTCERAVVDDAADDEPLLHAEGCQCLLAKVVIGVLGATLGGVAGLHIMARWWS